jgi:hypothetical protein
MIKQVLVYGLWSMLYLYLYIHYRAISKAMGLFVLWFWFEEGIEDSMCVGFELLARQEN